MKGDRATGHPGIIAQLIQTDPLPSAQEVARSEPFGDEALAAVTELIAALADRTQKQTADRSLVAIEIDSTECRLSGELMAIYEREAIESLRRHGKHDLADRYERALADAPPPQPIDYVGEACEVLA